jgi:hypothetical protein
MNWREYLLPQGSPGVIGIMNERSSVMMMLMMRLNKFQTQPGLTDSIGDRRSELNRDHRRQRTFLFTARERVRGNEKESESENDRKGNRERKSKDSFDTPQASQGTSPYRQNTSHPN